jgi:hypothetical protein
MSRLPVRMEAAAVSARLQQQSRLVVLDPARRLQVKADFSPGAITRRLKLQSALRDACLQLGRSSTPGRPSLPQA